MSDTVVRDKKQIEQVLKEKLQQKTYRNGIHMEYTHFLQFLVTEPNNSSYKDPKQHLRHLQEDHREDPSRGYSRDHVRLLDAARGDDREAVPFLTAFPKRFRGEVRWVVKSARRTIPVTRMTDVKDEGRARRICGRRGAI